MSDLCRKARVRPPCYKILFRGLFPTVRNNSGTEASDKSTGCSCGCNSRPACQTGYSGTQSGYCANRNSLTPLDFISIKPTGNQTQFIHRKSTDFSFVCVKCLHNILLSK